MDIFLNNVREIKSEIIQKRELPKIPIIPALLNKLPDTINNLIFYYVGCKSRLSRMMEYPIKNIERCLISKQERIMRYVCRLYCNTLDIYTEEPRGEELLKLPQWVRKTIDAYLRDKSLKKQISGLTSDSYRSFEFKNQGLALRMRETLTKQLHLNEVYYYNFDSHYINEIRLMKESIDGCNDECDFID